MRWKAGTPTAAARLPAGARLIAERIPIIMLLFFGLLPLIAWLSTHFDGWHNEKQKLKKGVR